MRIHYVNLWSVSDDSNPVYPSSCAQVMHLSEGCTSTSQVPANIGLELSSTQTQGAPGPWYTEHADYWQTWQQGKALGADPNTGTLNSLSYYCLVEDNSCGFVPSRREGAGPAGTPPQTAARRPATSRRTQFSARKIGGSRCGRSGRPGARRGDARP